MDGAELGLIRMNSSHIYSFSTKEIILLSSNLDIPYDVVIFKTSSSSFIFHHYKLT